MATEISKLETWYAQHCDSLWEHSYGVSIETLDNPGWIIKIDLYETEAEQRTLDRVQVHRTESDWLDYKVVEKQFIISCGPLNLSESIKVFIDWFGQ